MPSGIRLLRPRSRPVTSPVKSLPQRRAVARAQVANRPGPEQSLAEKPPQAKAAKAPAAGPDSARAASPVTAQKRVDAAPARRANRRNPESPASRPSRNAEHPS